MSAKGAQLQAYFARKREQEHQHMQRTQAVSKYYDHWGKVTSRYENWTAPEYYKHATQATESIKSKKEKEATLSMRQEKLRDLFAREKFQYEEEMRDFEKRRTKRINCSTDQLQKTEERLREQERLKRKIEMEAKLYGKWRYGIDDDQLLFDNKSEHTTLAKLNWLDKQIEEQMLREKEEAKQRERELRFQEETRRIEEIQKQRQEIREKEIKEIRAMQDAHMERINMAKAESEALKSLESDMKVNLKDLEKEQELLEESTTALSNRSDIALAYNLKKIKVLIRQRSETFRKQIQLNIDILQRIRDYAQRQDAIDTVIQKYKNDLSDEALAMTKIEAMYESEAKYNLQRCEDAWREKNMARYQESKRLMEYEHIALTTKLKQNLEKQNELVELRSTLLSAIDNSNEKLKQLINEQGESPRVFGGGAGDGDGDGNAKSAKGVTDADGSRSGGGDSVAKTKPTYEDLPSARSMPSARSSQRRPASSVHFNLDPNGTLKDSCSDKIKINDTFSNLNLIGSQNLPSAPGGIDSTQMATSRSLSVVSADNAERPRFGRKRVAWT